MDCADVDNALVNTGTPLPPQAEEHVSNCPRCQKLLRSLNASLATEPLSPATLREIEQRIAVDLSPVKPVPLARLVATFAGIFVFAVGASALYPGALGLMAMSPVQAGVIFGALAAGAIVLTDSLMWQMVPGSKHRVQPEILPIFVFLALVVVVVALFSFQRELNFWGEWWYCFRVGAPVALLAAAPFWLILRRGAILSLPAAGATAGLLAGLVGSTMLEIRCSNLDAWHILISHFGVAATGALVGLLAGWYRAKHAAGQALAA